MTNGQGLRCAGQEGTPLLARVLGHPMSALGELQDTAWDGGSRQAEGIGCQCGQGSQSAVSVIISPNQAARSPKHHAFGTPG